MAGKMLLLLLALGAYSSIAVSMTDTAIQEEASGPSLSSGELTEDDIGYDFGAIGTTNKSDEGYDTDVSCDDDFTSKFGKLVFPDDNDQAYSTSDDEFVSLGDAVKSPLGLVLTVTGLGGLAVYGGSRIIDLVKQSTSDGDRNASHKKSSAEDHSPSFEEFKVLARKVFSDPEAVCDRVRRDGPYVLLDDSVCRAALLKAEYKQAFCAILQQFIPEYFCTQLRALLDKDQSYLVSLIVADSHVFLTKPYVLFGEPYVNRFGDQQQEQLKALYAKIEEYRIKAENLS